MPRFTYLRGWEILGERRGNEGGRASKNAHAIGKLFRCPAHNALPHGSLPRECGHRSPSPAASLLSVLQPLNALWYVRSAAKHKPVHVHPRQMHLLGLEGTRGHNFFHLEGGVGGRGVRVKVWVNEW